MSAGLIDTIRGERRQRIAEEQAFLADRQADSLDQMRLRQGTIRGLAEALDVVSRCYRDFNG